MTLVNTVDGFLPLVDLNFADKPDGESFGLYVISSASDNLFKLNLPSGKVSHKSLIRFGSLINFVSSTITDDSRWEDRTVATYSISVS